MDQRVAFIADWQRAEWTMTELAERYQISRKTAYKWADRYEADPAAGLADRSRAPKAHGRMMADPIRAAILPEAVRTDNGTPFATTGAGHLSHLAVWWLKLGGRHERFHLTLQQETTTPPAATAALQQRRFDRMRREFTAA